MQKGAGIILTQPSGGDWTTAILCQLMMLISYHWLKERYCDDENDPNRVMTSLRLKDWGISADNLKKRGWSLGYVSTLILAGIGGNRGNRGQSTKLDEANLRLEM